MLCLRAEMKNRLISEKLKHAYIALEGENYNTVHYQKNGNRYLKMIAPVLQLSKAAKILDIGSGFCYLTKFFKNQGYEISAIDFFYGDIPKIRCEKSGIPFYLSNVEVDDLPFEEEYFKNDLFSVIVYISEFQRFHMDCC